jgi:hypothetical protein
LPCGRRSSSFALKVRVRALGKASNHRIQFAGAITGRGCRLIALNGGSHLRRRRGWGSGWSGSWRRRSGSLPPDKPNRISLKGGNILLAAEEATTVRAQIICNLAALSGPSLALALAHGEVRERRSAIAVPIDQSLNATTAFGLIYKGASRPSDTQNISLEGRQVWIRRIALTNNCAAARDAIAHANNAALSVAT